MTKYLLFLLFFFISSATAKTQESNLIVMDNLVKQENPVYIVKNVHEPLELICILKNATEELVSLYWVLPFKETNGTIEDIDEELYNVTSSALIHTVVIENGTAKLDFASLQTWHSGSYVCEANTNNTGLLNQSVELIVRPRKVSCSNKFECDKSHCIAIIYKCDGVPDCKSKIDESPEICGEDPCKGRIRCTNGRCIPKEWCKVCDPLKMNCTNKHRPDCCPQEPVPYPKGIWTYGDGPPNSWRHSEPNIQHHYDINFIQTTIYTIIGCALVFMIIVTILVIAICRVHMKRSQASHLTNNRRIFGSTAYHRALTQDIGVYDLDIATINRGEGTGLLVTYDISSGVQIIGSPIDPPPYSEVATLPPREGPPPPYTLSQPYDGREQVRNVRSVQCETSPKSGGRISRHGLANARVSSEPSLLNVNRL